MWGCRDAFRTAQSTCRTDRPASRPATRAPAPVRRQARLACVGSSGQNLGSCAQGVVADARACLQRLPLGFASALIADQREEKLERRGVPGRVSLSVRLRAIIWSTLQAADPGDNRSSGPDGVRHTLTLFPTSLNRASLGIRGTQNREASNQEAVRVWDWIQNASDRVVDTVVKDPLAALVLFVFGLMVGFVAGSAGRPRMR
jgi:hypothetical protein